MYPSIARRVGYAVNESKMLIVFVAKYQLFK